jgi:cellulose 1,4-beta-cellobiosidase
VYDKSTGDFKMLKLLNREITFTIELSTLVCGLNGSFYLVEMDKDGGNAIYPNGGYSALKGAGYCDSQCPRVGPYSEGERYGSCCSEMDIWQANSVAT